MASRHDITSVMACFIEMQFFSNFYSYGYHLIVLVYIICYSFVYERPIKELVFISANCYTCPTSHIAIINPSCQRLAFKVSVFRVNCAAIICDTGESCYS